MVTDGVITQQVDGFSSMYFGAKIGKIGGLVWFVGYSRLEFM